jgi:hypothetical protein
LSHRKLQEVLQETLQALNVEDPMTHKFAKIPANPQQMCPVQDKGCTVYRNLVNIRRYKNTGNPTSRQNPTIHTPQVPGATAKYSSVSYAQAVAGI